MRLAFITQDFLPDLGGIQTYSYELAIELNKLCEHFVLIAPEKEGQEKIDKHLDFPVYRIKSSNVLLGAKLISSLKDIVLKEKIDTTYHAQWMTAHTALKLRDRGVLKQVAIVAHGRELLFNPYKSIPLLGNWYKKLQKNIIGKGDKFYPVSNYTGDLLREQGVPDYKINVLPNRTNPKSFYPKNVDDLKKRLGIEGKKVIFTVARLIERKGVQDVLKVLPNVIKQIPNVHYLVAGTGPYGPRLKKMVTDLNISSHITFLGDINYDNIIDYYNASDIYTMISRDIRPDVEGFGIVYLESGACGVPSVAADVGGVSDAVMDGETGILVPYDNHHLIEENIVKLLKDDVLRKQMGQNAIDRVKSVANWTVAAKDLYATLKLS